MSVGVMKDNKLKLRNLRASYTLKGVPVGVPHLQSENTIVHASIIRNVSFQKKSLPAVFELDQAMWDAVRTPKHNTGLGVHET